MDDRLPRVGLRFERDRQRTLLVGVFRGVRQQVLEHLRQPDRIAVDPHRRCRQGADKAVSLALDQRPGGLHRAGDHRAQVGRLEPKQNRALRDPRDVAQVVDLPRDMADLAHQRGMGPGDVLVVAGDALQHRRCIADRHQRIAQLVAQHRQELVLAARGLAQRLLGRDLGIDIDHRADDTGGAGVVAARHRNGLEPARPAAADGEPDHRLALRRRRTQALQSRDELRHIIGDEQVAEPPAGQLGRRDSSVAPNSNAVSALSRSGDRWITTTKAQPVTGGNAPNSRSSASTPPADVPTATVANGKRSPRWRPPSSAAAGARREPTPTLSTAAVRSGRTTAGISIETIGREGRPALPLAARGDHYPAPSWQPDRTHPDRSRDPAAPARHVPAASNRGSRPRTGTPDAAPPRWGR